MNHLAVVALRWVLEYLGMCLLEGCVHHYVTTTLEAG